MFDVFADLAQRPECFSVSTVETLWTDPHISRRMLDFHLDPNSPLASRQPEHVEGTAAWLDATVNLRGKRVVDLGCGPGLYAEQFHERGAIVTGVDWSKTALAHAEKQAATKGQGITYIHADYTSNALPQQTDLITLIYCDFCALPPPTRHQLLLSIRDALRQGGRLAFDVLALPAFEMFQETTLFERRLMDGFWSAGDYVGLKRSFKYPDEHVTLERYLIVEPSRHWSVYNWLQYFTTASLRAELTAAGFDVEHLTAGLTGEAYTDASDTIAVIARAA